MPVFSAGGLGAFAVTTNSSQGISGTKTFSPLTVGGVPIIAQGLVGQTGSLQQWQNSSAQTLFAIASDGTLSNPVGNIVRVTSQLNVNSDLIAQAGFTLFGSAKGNNTPFTVIASAAATPVIAVRGAASQTANLAEFQNSAGTVLAKYDAFGSVFAPYGVFGDIATTINTGRFRVATTAASEVGAVVRGFASQTGDLTQWQNSAGTSILRVLPTGNLAFSSNFTQFGNIGFTIAGGSTTPHAATIAYGDGSGWQLRFITNSGTQTTFANLSDKGDMVLNGTLQVMADSTRQGVSNVGLQVGNDLIIYDVNITNSIGFAGVANAEAATIYLGRSSNAAPRISGNDVNKTLVLGGDNSGGASQVILNSIALSGGTPQFTLAGQAAATGVQHTGYMRFEGPGVRHGEITYHPAENYFRFRGTSGSLFDSWATILASSFAAQSTEASKTNIATLEMGSTPSSLVRGSVKAPVGALRDRMKKLRPVSYNSAGNPDGDTLYSFVAEEAAEVVPEIVSLDGDGKPAGINVLATGVLTFALVQELMQRVEILEAELRSK